MSLIEALPLNLSASEKSWNGVSFYASDEMSIDWAFVNLVQIMMNCYLAPNFFSSTAAFT